MCEILVRKPSQDSINHNITALPPVKSLGGRQALRQENANAAADQRETKKRGGGDVKKKRMDDPSSLLLAGYIQLIQLMKAFIIRVCCLTGGRIRSEPCVSGKT